MRKIRTSLLAATALGRPVARYGFSERETLDYTYEINDDTLTIWMGERNSPAYYQGTFSEDGDTLNGAWHYPGGGGYSTVSTRTAST